MYALLDFSILLQGLPEGEVGVEGLPARYWLERLNFEDPLLWRERVDI